MLLSLLALLLLLITVTSSFPIRLLLVRIFLLASLVFVCGFSVAHFLVTGLKVCVTADCDGEIIHINSFTLFHTPQSMLPRFEFFSLQWVQLFRSQFSVKPPLSEEASGVLVRFEVLRLALRESENQAGDREHTEGQEDSGYPHEIKFGGKYDPQLEYNDENERGCEPNPLHSCESKPVIAPMVECQPSQETRASNENDRETV
mmetsp:Transcript_5746/g.11393  ORF Transcript_5746/g.11393 Transcript_5746/m.11393 type:complete len:203 (-) Transcript_5746:417-1025(-)